MRSVPDHSGAMTHRARPKVSMRTIPNYGGAMTMGGHRGHNFTSKSLRSLIGNFELTSKLIVSPVSR